MDWERGDTLSTEAEKRLLISTLTVNLMLVKFDSSEAPNRMRHAKRRGFWTRVNSPMDQ